VHSCSIVWTARKEPPRVTVTGLRPAIRTDRRLLMSGPYEHVEQADSASPNVVIVAVEGLGTAHLSGMGHKRKTTPSLDKFAYASVFLPNGFAPTPEPGAGCMTLLTGLSPLRHGYLGDHRGPLPERFKLLSEVLHAKRYASAAFTEGEAANDLTWGTGFEAGFEVFDPSYQRDPESSAADNDAESEAPGDETGPKEPQTIPAAGSRVTLAKARGWIDQHKDVRFVVFVRLRELRELRLRDRYGTPFSKKGWEPAPVDIYDTALAYLDRQLGQFIAHIRDHETRQNTVIIVTSPYGFDFSAGDSEMPRVGLSEETLRVPVFVYAHWIPRRRRDDLVALQDVAPSVLGMAGTQFGAVIDGQDFMGGPNGSQPVSVFGDPLVLTMRSSAWRLYWETGRRPFADSETAPDGRIQLFNVPSSLRKGWTRNVAASHPDTVARWRSRLESQLTLHDRTWIEAQSR